MAEKMKPQPINSVLLHDTPAARALLTKLSLATATPQVEELGGKHSILETGAADTELLVSDAMTCGCCGCTFVDRYDQTEHYKTDWHRYNLKQKLRGRQVVSEDQFEEMTGGDMSSISGSDTESGDSDADDDPLAYSTSKLPDDDQGSNMFHVEGFGHRHPRVFFRNGSGELLSLYRCVLHGKKSQPENLEDLVAMATELPDHMTWAILMTAGGHFAGAVFQNEKMVVHKTFHRYVVRAKRGTAQSMQDKKGHAPHSAGASLRRYNEAALNQEVSDLLASWSDHLKNCHAIFVRAPSFNRTIFFGGKTPALDKSDARIRNIPFPTRRPTCKELLRVHTLLCAVECFGMESSIRDHFLSSPKKVVPKVNQPTQDRSPAQLRGSRLRQADQAGPESAEDDDSGPDYNLEIQSDIIDFGGLKEFECTKKPRRRKKKTKKGATDEEGKSNSPETTSKQTEESGDQDELHMKLRNELFTACKTGNIDKLQDLVNNLRLTAQDGDNISYTNQSSDTRNSGESMSNNTEDTPHNQHISREDMVAILNRPFGDNSRTLLHVVAMGEHKGGVNCLMEAGADPNVRDKTGTVPYLATSSKEIRNEFRQFSGRFPDMYDYAQAQIPEPLDPAREQEKKAREAERRKIQKKARKEKMKDKKEEEREKEKEEREKQRFIGLSDREKRALAAEKRLTSQLSGQGQSVPCLSRCFQCGTDITGKVPFEYMDYKFCTPKCLKSHRMKMSAGKS